MTLDQDPSNSKKSLDRVVRDPDTKPKRSKDNACSGQLSVTMKQSQAVRREGGWDWIVHVTLANAKRSEDQARSGTFMALKQSQVVQRRKFGAGRSYTKRSEDKGL
jgi:hypothetical protein